MKTNLPAYLVVILFLGCFTASAQVAIGTTSLEPGVAFQLESEDKGLMIPKVELTSRLDTSTITPAEVEGLWVYNTADAGSGNDRVSEGMYFWDGDEWIRIYNQGYSEQFFQTSYQKARNLSQDYTLPGLDQDITVPYTGTYQVIVVGYYASGLQRTSGAPGIGTSSIWLEIDNDKKDEMWLTSTSKNIPTSTGNATFHALATSGIMIFNVDLEGGTSYNFQVKARQWDEDNSRNNFLDGIFGYGYWGIHTNIYNGNTHSGADPDCQRNYMTLTLLRQF